MKRSLILRASFLVISGFCIVLLYSMASWSTGIFNFQNMNTDQQSSSLPHRRQDLISDPESINALMMDISENNNQNGPGKYAEQKIIHLDFKGMPLLPKFMEQLFPFLKKLGATGILVEYEDMFPFSDPIKSISSKDAYSKEDIRYLNELAEANNLEVIPLLQTFGHLEYVLKLEEFSELREVARYPQVVCPTNNKSLTLIKTMIDQIISLHPNIKHLHIGSDEVYFLGMCPLCTHRMAKDHIVEHQLFLDHAKLVANYVIETYNPVRVLMWDDEFRKLDEDVIISSELGKLVDIVVWNYDPQVQNFLTPELWQKYSRIFDSLWMGSAFKGANKPNSMIVNETRYLSNHMSWINLAKEQSRLVKFKGIVITGWQRYDHFAVPCEIFPVAIPSLTSCLIYTTSTKFLDMNEVFSVARYILRCTSRLEACSFPGSNIYDYVKTLYAYQLEWKEMKTNSIFLGWLNAFNINQRFSSPALVESAYQNIQRLYNELVQLKHQFESSLTEVFPISSAQEWLLVNFEPFFKEIKDLHKGASEILEKKTFPLRPLNMSLEPDA